MAATPEPPRVAVILTSTRTDDTLGSAAMSARMDDLAARQPGFLSAGS